MGPAACSWGTPGGTGPRNGREPRDNAGREHWRRTLDPAWRLATRKTPIAWFTGANDRFYPMSALMKTYELAAGPKRLMLLPNWHHALPAEAGDPQLFDWLGIYLNDRPKTLEVRPVIVANKGGRVVAEWQFDARQSSIRSTP